MIHWIVFLVVTLIGIVSGMAFGYVFGFRFGLTFFEDLERQIGKQMLDGIRYIETKHFSDNKEGKEE